MFLFSRVVHAQSAAGIAISPLTFELTANPGETITNALRVSNPTSAAIIFDMEVEDFTAAGESGEVIVAETGDDTYSMKKWVAVAPPRFTVEPGQTEIVSFAITIPRGAEPGGHYGTILAVVKGTIGNGTGAAIAQKVGALVLLSVSGHIREELFVREFSAPSFSESGPVPFTIRLDNSGSVHVRPLGFVTIADFRGNKLVDLPFPQRNVLPGSTRKMTLEWPKRYPIGKFTATLVGSFGISNTPISAVTTFWIFPWRIALGIFVFILALLALLVKLRRRFRAAFQALMKGERASF